jgi:hypothetical protein
MSYLAAMLLLYMDDFTGFQLFANLLNAHMYFDFFRLDRDRMNVHLQVYEQLFAEELPGLYSYFHSLELKTEMYIIDWILTVFSRSLPIDVAARVWDFYLYEGELFIFKVALGILRYVIC